jgi:RNA polymerase sigma factor (sigma-70 family)
MATTPLGAVLHGLRRCWLRTEEAGLTDGELLERFLARRDGDAFAALVGRHGPMVLAVCRRVLRNEADAEDAFQAVFLVLIRKAATIRPRGLVGNWLYGVSHTTALKARDLRARRSAREREAAARPRPEVAAETWNDGHALLHQELRALPDKYRAAIVLCDLEGEPIKEAARRLGCPAGTLGARLTRGRSLLASRLARRGLTLSGGVIAAVLAQDAAAAGVPPALAASTAEAARLYSAGGTAAAGAISAPVAALTEGVLKIMSPIRLKSAVAALLAVVVAAGAGIVLFPARADQPPQPEKAERPAPREREKPTTDPKPVAVQEDGIVRQAAWNPNGKTVALVALNFESVTFKDADGNDTDTGAVLPNMTIKLRDAKTGELQRSLGEERHTNIMAAAFSPDGKTAAYALKKLHPPEAAGKPGEIRVVDAQTWEVKDKVEFDGGVWGLAFSPDGTRLAFGGRSRLADDAAFVKLWDVQKRKRIGGTDGVGFRISCLAFSRDGKLLATGDEKGKVRLFDGRTGEAIGVFEGHGECVSGVGFAPDGKTLVSGGWDGALKVWDVEAGKLLRNLEGSKGAVTALAFSPDGRRFATARDVGEKDKPAVEVLVWDAKVGEVKQSLPGQTRAVNALAFSSDGGTLAVGAGDSVRLGPDTPDGRLDVPGEFKLWKLGPPAEKK